MVMTTGELQCLELDEVKYWFRTPTPRDLPKMRRKLTREGVRRPMPAELQGAALAGIVALAASAGDPEEGKRQAALMEQWYGLLAPILEDEIDEADFELRAAELTRLVEERRAEQQEIIAEVAAIEANLGRHWPPYAELLADRAYWDEILAIECVRLLLQRIDDGKPPRDAEGMLEDASYEALPLAARPALSAFALRLLVPSEEERKN